MTNNGLVLLHGWAMNAAVWSDLHWPQTWQNRVMAPDLPGHGKMQESSAVDSLQVLADWFIAGAPRDRIWLGWSLGGMVLLQAVASMVAQGVGPLPPALVLVGVTPKFVNDSTWKYGIDAPVLQTFAENFSDYRNGIQRFLHLQLGNSRGQRALAARVGRALLERGIPADFTLSSGIEMLKNLDLRPLLSSIPMPVRVLQGSRDRVCSVAAARYLVDHLPAGEYISFPHLGHMPFIEQPQQFAAAICRGWV